LVGLFVWTTACTAYKQIEVEEVAAYGNVRVTIGPGRRLLIAEPTVANDSIAGLTKKGEPTTVAIQDIEGLEGQYVHAGKTVALVLGVTVIVASVIVAATCVEEGYFGPTWGC
jgi:hypothetical protein